MSRRLKSCSLIVRRAFLPAAMVSAVIVAWGLSILSSPGDVASAANRPQEQGPLVELMESSSQGLTLDVAVPSPREDLVQRGATAYRRLTLPNAGSTSVIGAPELPSFGRYVAIPRGAQVQIEVLADTAQARTGYLIYPAQEPRVEQGEEPPFTLDAAAYQTDELRPSEIVTVEGPYTIRGLEVVLLRFHPVQYNPVAETVRLHSTFRVRVAFAGGGPMAPDERLRSPYFEPLFASILLNYADVDSAHGLGANLSSGTGCDLLIITAPHLLNQANLLADWKIHRGISTCVRTTSETGLTAPDIRSYIQGAYDTWSPPPSFVLFLGDAELIPTNYQTVHPQQEPAGSLIPTDLYYATVDGTDYFPDLSTGRISVDTASQASNIINKIVNYERKPAYQASFYSTVALAAYFQDEEPDGREDRDWVRTSEEVGSYVGGLGYDEQRIFYAEPWVDPLYYKDGTSLPFYLLRDNGFPWIGSTAEIVNWVNYGALILNHRDHGWRMMWETPELQVSDVLGLTNGRRLPVVFSMNCETGWFDNETDSASHGTSSGEVNFAEAWQRNDNGGAAGVVAPTRVSYSGYNDHLDKGLFDAIWPDFLAYTPAPGPSSSPQYRMGQVLDYAKLYMATVYGESVSRQITFEMFHYFGDPTMEIWTAQPSIMAVQHSGLYLADAADYVVGVEDGALVSLVKDGEILGTALSSGGEAQVTLPSLLTPGPIDLTVTKHNRRPYQATIQAVTQDMSFRGYVPLAPAQ